MGDGNGMSVEEGGVTECIKGGTEVCSISRISRITIPRMLSSHNAMRVMGYLVDSKERDDSKQHIGVPCCHYYTRSRRMRMVRSPESAAIRRSSVILMSAVSVLWSGRKPD